MKREKLYKQMIESPYELVDLNKNTLFLDLDNDIKISNIRISDLTEFLNIFNTIISFYVKNIFLFLF